MMNIDLKHPSQLSEDERAAWTDMRAHNPRLYSPYFHMDYTQMIGELRPKAKVAVIRAGEGIIGFLPFEGARLARPIGLPITDYHGVICRADQSLDLQAVLAGVKIGAYRFTGFITGSDNVEPLPCDRVRGGEEDADETPDASLDASPDPKTKGAANPIGSMPCAALEFTNGIEAWRDQQGSSYRSHLKSNRRKIRKAEKDIGPVRLVTSCDDTAVYEQLMAWKRQKFSATGKYDVLSADWVESALAQLWAGKRSGLRADLHALYFGDHLVAADLGITDGDTFHSWIVGYDSDMSSYGPGIQLLERMLSSADELGYRCVDFGVGTEGYKRHYATKNINAHHGFIAARGAGIRVGSIWARGYGRLERFGDRHTLAGLGRVPGRARRRYAQISACEPRRIGRIRAMAKAMFYRNKT